MRKTALLALALFLVAATALPDCSTLTNITENIPEFTVGDHVNFQIEMKNDPTRPGISADPAPFAKALYAILKERKLVDRAEI